MSNDLTIALSFGSLADVRRAVDAGADAPSPLSLDALGAPAGTSGPGADQSSSQAPEPLPLDQLLDQLPPASSDQDAAAPEPSPPGASSSADNDDAPSPPAAR